MIEKVGNSVFSNDDIVFGDIDSDIVTFLNNDIGLKSIKRNNIDQDDDPKTINHVGLMACYNRYKQPKHIKKDRWRINACSMASKLAAAFCIQP